MVITKKLLVMAIAGTLACATQAAISPDEAKQLGSTLTPVGAEVAGNKDGTIPAWEGGLKTPPASFKAGDMMRPDPFAEEKPRLVITSKNMEAEAARLTAGTQHLLKKHSSFRVDVYPTHRTVGFPERVVKNTAANAVRANTLNNGVGIEGAIGGYPFPIPKTGNEVMWNHLLRYIGNTNAKYDSWNVDASGKAWLATRGESFQEYPYYDPAKTEPAKESDPYYRIKLYYSAPNRRAGEALMVTDAVNPLAEPRKAHIYLPGQRRVKLAPDIAYDTPNPGAAGGATYDDAFVFNGAMDRFDFKLVGKQEMYIPYNTYRVTYNTKAEDLTTANFLNPDHLRWELHRVWVVDATLKDGKRHVYSKRRFYIDEDSWFAIASDEYDARGNLYRSGFGLLTYSYDVQSATTGNHMTYDFVAGTYNLTGLYGPHGGLRYLGPLPTAQWSPDALAGAGIR